MVGSLGYFATSCLGFTDPAYLIGRTIPTLLFPPGSTKSLFLAGLYGAHSMLTLQPHPFLLQEWEIWVGTLGKGGAALCRSIRFGCRCCCWRLLLLLVVCVFLLFLLLLDFLSTTPIRDTHCGNMVWAFCSHFCCVLVLYDEGWHGLTERG